MKIKMSALLLTEAGLRGCCLAVEPNGCAHASHQCLAGQGHQRLPSRYRTGPKLPAWPRAQVYSGLLSAGARSRRSEGAPRTSNLFYTDQSEKSPLPPVRGTVGRGTAGVFSR